MPNGGSDCCGSCWFYSKNIEEPENRGSENDDVDVCTIRDLEIFSPYYTYCANHPNHNKNKIDIPIGFVYEYSDYSLSRQAWGDTPDNENVRLKLLELLGNISNEPETKYPTETDIEEEIIKHLRVLKEKRAIPGLNKIIQFDIEYYRNNQGYMLRNKAVIVGQAIEALLEISEGEFIENVEHFINYGIESASPETYNQENDNFVTLRHHLVRGLKHAKGPKAKQLLQVALDDPHYKVNASANEILNERNEN